MPVEVIIEAEDWKAVDLGALADRAAGATLTHLGLAPSDWDISILGCDNNKIAKLNADFRGKARPTNVLSWPSEERGAERDGAVPDAPNSVDPELGDIAIAYETCRNEAEAAGKPITNHVLHLIIHGVLHLLGYDHEREGDATLMEGLERQILGNLGIPDPY